MKIEISVNKTIQNPIKLKKKKCSHSQSPLLSQIYQLSNDKKIISTLVLSAAKLRTDSTLPELRLHLSLQRIQIFFSNKSDSQFRLLTSTPHAIWSKQVVLLQRTKFARSSAFVFKMLGGSCLRLDTKKVNKFMNDTTFSIQKIYVLNVCFAPPHPFSSPFLFSASTSWILVCLSTRR